MLKNKKLVDLLGVEGPKIYNIEGVQNNTLDSYLVAYFSTINKRYKTIFDLGCGTGAISLYLSLRTSALIKGVEINEEIASLAREAVKINKLDKQIEIICEDIKNLKKIYPASLADLVVSNPPYFKVGSGEINKNDLYDAARREVSMTFFDLAKVASFLLKDGGIFSFVHKSSRFPELIQSLAENRLIIKSLKPIYSKKCGSAELILIEAVKNGSNNGFRVEEPLYIFNEDESYTKDALKIFNGEISNEEK